MGICHCKTKQKSQKNSENDKKYSDEEFQKYCENEAEEYCDIYQIWQRSY